MFCYGGPRGRMVKLIFYIASKHVKGEISLLHIVGTSLLSSPKKGVEIFPIRMEG